MAELTSTEAEEQAACCSPQGEESSRGGAGEGQDVREEVRRRYAAAATHVASREGSCCAPGGPIDAGEEVFGAALYEAGDREQLPDAARLASLGCGIPTAVAELREGETVLDLGSGGGHRRAARPRAASGRPGWLIGLDMTDEMLELARANAADAGIENVEFLKGYIEDIPLPDASVDVVISNCVINLSGDKPQVIARGRAGAEARRALCGLGRDRRRGHGRGDPRRHAPVDGLHRRCAHARAVRARPRRRRTRRRADRRDAPRPRLRRLGDSARPQAGGMSAPEVHLHDPQTLYRRWEESQWNPWDIDLSVDREQWEAMADRTLLAFVLGSLMVAEERITTKFSGLVGAGGGEEEIAYLATQQVDEARHMQFYARFQDEVVSEPALIAAHVERARAQISPAFRTIFDEQLTAAHDRLLAAPGDVAAKVAFVTIYHLTLEATLGLTTYEFATRFMRREGLLPGFVAGYSRIHHDEHRHIGYGIWFLRDAVARDAAMGDVVRSTLRELLPAVAGSLTPPPGGDSSLLGASPDEIRTFALDGLKGRLSVIGVPIESL